MSDLDWLSKTATRYGLICERLNDTTLKVFSPKYSYDSWLIIECEDSFELLHKNRAHGKKCYYHLQKKVEKKKKLWLLQRINSHNRYTSKYKSKKGCEFVDNVLRRKKRFKIY